jgi:hypothetical protein
MRTTSRDARFGLLSIMTDDWRQQPKDDAWRQVHLAHVESLGSRLWLRCNACGHSLTPQPRDFAEARHLEMITPLLIIARRLRCARCGKRKAHCWPEPYGLAQDQNRLSRKQT